MVSAGMDTSAKRGKYEADYAKLVATLPTAGASAIILIAHSLLG